MCGPPTPGAVGGRREWCPEFSDIGFAIDRRTRDAGGARFEVDTGDPP
jgi:hypothetical protein